MNRQGTKSLAIDRIWPLFDNVYCWLLFFFGSGVEIEFRALHTLGKHSTTELHPQPDFLVIGLTFTYLGDIMTS